MKEKFVEFIKNNMSLVIGGLLGFLIALLFIILGFFRALFLILLTGIGALIGGVPAVRRKIVEWVDIIYEVWSTTRKSFPNAAKTGFTRYLETAPSAFPAKSAFPARKAPRSPASAGRASASHSSPIS